MRQPAKGTEMVDEKKCIKCGSAELEPGVVQSTGRVHFRAQKTKLLSFQTSDITIRANICLQCGFIELIGDFHKAQSVTGRAKAA